MPPMSKESAKGLVEGLFKLAGSRIKSSTTNLNKLMAI